MACRCVARRATAFLDSTIIWVSVLTMLWAILEVSILCLLTISSLACLAFALKSVESVVVKDPLLAKARTLNPAEAIDKIKKNGGKFLARERMHVHAVASAKRAQSKKNDKPAPKKKRGLDLDVTVDDD